MKGHRQAGDVDPKARYEPPPNGGRGGLPVRAVLLVAFVVIVFLLLHLTGVFGPGAH
jgi:hypothetical protein